jgi:hypothetical protein
MYISISMKKNGALSIIIIGCIVMLNGCKNIDKIACNDILQQNIRKEKIYNEVMKSALIVLPNLKNKDGRIPYANSAFIVSSKIDSAIFFNEKKDKCLLLLLQKTDSEQRVDQVRIVQGTLKNSIWEFSYDRLPEVPEEIVTVDKQIKNKLNLNRPFNFLSLSGREFILTAGTTFDNDCKIDMKYWFGE